MNKINHERSSAMLQLKMFTNDNLRMTKADQDPHSHIVLTRTGFKQAKDVGEAILALNNLKDMWRFYHPYDPSMQAIFRVVLEHYVAGNLATSGVGPVNNFFKVATLENAHSAGNEGLPLTYSELVSKFDQVNRRNISYGKPAPSANMVDTIVDKVTERLKKKGGQGKNHSGKLWCKDFNVQPGCSHKQVGNGCVAPDQTVYRHGCNVRVQGGRLCGMQHPAFKHT